MNTTLLQYDGTIPPCGIFCGRCPNYLRSKNRCNGAETDCRKCKSIYVCCVEKRGHKFCYECTIFPCSRFKKFAATWIKYNQDLIANQKLLRDKGKDYSFKTKRD